LQFCQGFLKKYHPSLNVNAQIGDFVFGRYICSAIVAPVHWGLIDSAPDEISQSSLVFTGRILQHLSMGKKFNGTDEFYSKMNDFITSNADDMRSFMQYISKDIPITDLHEADKIDDKDVIPDAAHYEALTVLKGIINSHKEPLFHKLEFQFTKNLEELNLTNNVVISKSVLPNLVMLKKLEVDDTLSK